MYPLRMICELHTDRCPYQVSGVSPSDAGRAHQNGSPNPSTRLYLHLPVPIHTHTNTCARKHTNRQPHKPTNTQTKTTQTPKPTNACTRMHTNTKKRSTTTIKHNQTQSNTIKNNHTQPRQFLAPELGNGAVFFFYRQALGPGPGPGPGGPGAPTLWLGAGPRGPMGPMGLSALDIEAAAFGEKLGDSGHGSKIERWLLGKLEQCAWEKWGGQPQPEQP